MTFTKTDLKRVLRETAANHPVLTPLQKFQVLESVCDGLLERGQITERQHKLWVNVY